jgi:hypothetical protein
MRNWNEWKYSPKSPDELSDIIDGIVDGSVFTSDQVDNPVLVPEVFFVSKLGGPPFAEAIRRERITLLYAHKKSSQPERCGRYPVFLECKLLNHEDAEVVRDGVVKRFNDMEKDLERGREEFNRKG